MTDVAQADMRGSLYVFYLFAIVEVAVLAWLSSTLRVLRRPETFLVFV